MQNTEPGGPVSGPTEERATLELEKLRAEVATLRRPNISVWVTALIGALGVGIQYCRSSQEYLAASIQRDKAELDVARLNNTKDSVRKEVRGDSEILVRSEIALQRAQFALDSTQARRSQAEVGLAGLQVALKAFQDTLAAAKGENTAAHAAAQRVLSQATASVDRVGTAIRQSTELTARASDSLRVIRAELTTKGGLSPGSPVVATLHLPFRAHLTYRRWVAKDVIIDAGTLDSGDVALKLPYGSYMYFDAKDLSTGRVAQTAADCRSSCDVYFE
jgi:hypothetical protein